MEIFQVGLKFELREVYLFCLEVSRSSILKAPRFFHHGFNRLLGAILC